MKKVLSILLMMTLIVSAIVPVTTADAAQDVWFTGMWKSGDITLSAERYFDEDGDTVGTIALRKKGKKDYNYTLTRISKNKYWVKGASGVKIFKMNVTKNYIKLSATKKAAKDVKKMAKKYKLIQLL